MVKNQCKLFLMHRVELKAISSILASKGNSKVPNAPCGVERWVLNLMGSVIVLFLMHRVELKAEFL